MMAAKEARVTKHDAERKVKIWERTELQMREVVHHRLVQTLELARRSCIAAAKNAHSEQCNRIDRRLPST